MLFLYYRKVLWNSYNINTLKFFKNKKKKKNNEINRELINKHLHILQNEILTTRTYNDKFTNEKGRERMKIIEANIDYKLIGERIKEARKKAGL